MRSKWWFSVLILSLAINIAAFSAAGYNYYCQASRATPLSCPISPADQHLYRQLSLSAPQLARMESLAHSFHAGIEALAVEMQGEKELLLSLLMEKNADPAAVENLRKDVAQIQDNIQKEFIDHIQQIKEILDEAQQARFFRMLRASMEREQNQWFFQSRSK